MNQRFGRMYAGRPISARTENDKTEALRRVDAMPLAGGIIAGQTAMGQSLQAALRLPIWVNLTGVSNGQYSGQEVLQASGTAAATALVTSDAVAGFTITDSGAGYVGSTPPAVTITGGGGSGATATAVLDGLGGIASLTLTAPGSGYTSAPTVMIAPPVAPVVGNWVDYADGLILDGVTLWAQEVNNTPVAANGSVVVQCWWDASGSFLWFAAPVNLLTGSQWVQPANTTLNGGAYPCRMVEGYNPGTEEFTSYVGLVISVSSTITAGTRSVTPASMSGIAAGVYLLVNNATQSEFVLVQSATANNFTATFINTYTGGATLTVGGAGWLSFPNAFIPTTATPVLARPEPVNPYTDGSLALWVDELPIQPFIGVGQIGWLPFTFTYAQFAAGTQWATDYAAYVPLYQLPYGWALLGFKIQTTTAFGGGGMDTYTISLCNYIDPISGAPAYNGNLQTLLGAQPVYEGATAVGASNFLMQGCNLYSGDSGSGYTSPVTLYLEAENSQGIALDLATQGVVNVWLLLTNTL